MPQTRGFAATEGGDIFPFHPLHNHSAGIAVLPDKTLLVVFYRGTGERTADDVRVMGSRQKKGTTSWETPS